MQALGILHKMPTLFIHPVHYFLPLESDKIAMNEFLGKTLKLRWTGHIFCTLCGRETPKSFGEGLCYSCFANAPENAECIIRPELCEAHLGKGRDPQWEKAHHLQPHFVYLALTDRVKVGVTRSTQIPTRWIDQGAYKAIILAETPYRQLAGLIEVALKEHLADKTNWQRMLKNEMAVSVDLVAEKEKAKQLLTPALQQYVRTDNEVVELQYPVIRYPSKVQSLSFEKLNPIEMTLAGIRGQYLLFNGGFVLNIRRNSGYEVELSA